MNFKQKARIALSAIAIFAVVGGAYAVKAKRSSLTLYVGTTNTTLPTRTITKAATTDEQIPNATLYFYTTTATTFPTATAFVYTTGA